MRWEISPVASLHGNNQPLTETLLQFPMQQVYQLPVGSSISSLMNKSLCGNKHNACLWLRLLFFKNFILREEDNNSLSLQVATALIVCRAVSYKHYVCLTDAFWYQSHPCTCFISHIFSCCTMLGSVSQHCKACSDHCKQKGILRSGGCTLRWSGLKHIPLRPPGVQSRAAVHLPAPDAQPSMEN